MKTLLYILTLLFTILTFIGCAAVLISNGSLNAGYSIIPMLGTLTCHTLYKSAKK